MKFHLTNQWESNLMKKTIMNYLITGLLSTLISIPVFSQDLPEKPVPPRLVNDFAGMLTNQEVNALEQKLDLFNDSTTTQISIVTVSDLGGYDKSDFAQRLAEKWGIGQRGRNNGVLILVKPKTGTSKGEVHIASGYGLEGVIPDIVCGEIVDYEILPSFRSGDYYGGLDRAVNTLMSLARGEFTADQYGKSRKRGSKTEAPPFILIIILVVFIISVISRKSGGSNHKNISTGGLPLWMLLGMMGSGRNSHSGSWGGFSGGGGGGGGFGGFGGGSFGGGGAGGSW
jgi:uncharacterized protein